MVLRANEHPPFLVTVSPKITRLSVRTRTQRSGIRTRSLVIEYEFHRKRLSTITNARQVELTMSGSFLAAARLKAETGDAE